VLVEILDIQRMSTEDGPGLRTTVFFKGCNLGCAWCHNPESISFKPDLNWYRQKCIGCDTCKAVCPRGVITKDAAGVHFDRVKCAAGGKSGPADSNASESGASADSSCHHCVEACPNGAIELKGRGIPVEELCRELLKDRAYFGADGGITLSGGEVMMQGEAAVALARLLKDAGVHVALDTAGAYDFRVLEAILPFISMVLYDLKVFDPPAHKKFVGADNRIILENYRKLMEHKTSVWVRTPIIEGATDSEENIEALGRFIVGAGLPEKWELCAFNNLCRDKYERLDLDWVYKNTALTKKAHIEKLTAAAKQYVPWAVYSGSTRDT
jgi:pyruvate formate lyase activating enzyme